MVDKRLLTFRSSWKFKALVSNQSSVYFFGNLPWINPHFTFLSAFVHILYPLWSNVHCLIWPPHLCCCPSVHLINLKTWALFYYYQQVWVDGSLLKIWSRIPPRVLFPISLNFLSQVWRILLLMNDIPFIMRMWTSCHWFLSSRLSDLFWFTKAASENVTPPNKDAADPVYAVNKNVVSLHMTPTARQNL